MSHYPYTALSKTTDPIAIRERSGQDLWVDPMGRNGQRLGLLFLGLACMLSGAKTWAVPHVIHLVVSDFDGTYTAIDRNSALQGFNSPYIVFQVPESPIGWYRDPQGPKEIEIPQHDFEHLRRVGLLAQLYEGGKFTLGSLKPITLSNGVKFIPGHYYFDPLPDRSLRNFRSMGGDRPLIAALNEARARGNRWVGEGFPIFEAARLHEQGSSAIYWSARGHSPEEVVEALGLENNNQVFAISHESTRRWGNSPTNSAELRAKKIEILRLMLRTVGTAPLPEGATEHSIIVLEDNAEIVEAAQQLFLSYQRARVWVSKVNLVLVNLSSKEERTEPLPSIHLRESARQAVATRYKVTQIDADAVRTGSNDLSKALEWGWRVSQEDAAQILKTHNPCHVVLAAEGAK